MDVGIRAHREELKKKYGPSDMPRIPYDFIHLLMEQPGVDSRQVEYFFFGANSGVYRNFNHNLFLLQELMEVHAAEGEPMSEVTVKVIRRGLEIARDFVKKRPRFPARKRSVEVSDAR